MPTSPAFRRRRSALGVLIPLLLALVFRTAIRSDVTDCWRWPWSDSSSVPAMQWSNGAARNPVAMSSLSPDLAVVLEPPDRGTDLVIKLENRGYGTVELAAVTVFLNSGTFGDGVPFGCTSSSENIVRCLFYGIGEGRVATWSLQLIPNEGVETVSLLAISKMGGDGVSNTVEDGDPANDQAELVVQAPKLRVIT